MSARDRFKHLAAYEIWLTTGEWPSGPPTGFLAADDVTNALDELDEFDRLRVGGVTERAEADTLGAIAAAAGVVEAAGHVVRGRVLSYSMSMEIAHDLKDAGLLAIPADEQAAERAVLDAAAAMPSDDSATHDEIMAWQRHLIRTVRAWHSGLAPTPIVKCDQCQTHCYDDCAIEDARRRGAAPTAPKLLVCPSWHVSAWSDEQLRAIRVEPMCPINLVGGICGQRPLVAAPTAEETPDARA